MSQHYSDQSRENDPTALPDVETFQQAYAYCPKCESLMQDEDAAGRVHCLECATETTPDKRGWFYWFCLPGCLPDSEPFGPFATEDAALQDARANSPDPEPEPEPEPEPTEPDESDLTTVDHATFFQDGHVVLRRSGPRSWSYAANGRDAQNRAYTPLGAFGDDVNAAVRAYMDKTQFWPNCWFISDHGNAHIMDISKGKE